MPSLADREFVFAELIDSISFCDSLRCKAWSLSQLEDGFRLNVGPVEALTCIFGLDGDRPVVQIRKLLAGEDCVNKVHGPTAAISAASYKSAREPHWVFSSAFHPSQSATGSSAERVAVAHDLREIRVNHEAFLRLACTTSNGSIVKGTPFARFHCDGLTRYARSVVGHTATEEVTADSEPSAGNPAYAFEVGAAYDRKDVIAAVGVDPVPTGGDWYTGYTTHEGVSFIFCNIASAGRTGHEYNNYWDGDELEWSGKTKSRASWDSIKAMTEPGAEVHLFYRNADREPFTYAGLAVPVFVDEEAVPVRVRWRFEEPGTAMSGPKTLGRSHMEGGKTTRFVTTYERSGKARSDCLKHYGAKCSVCEFDFAIKYGDIGKGFMHVHHLKPVADGDGTEAQVDPVQDLRPVCPNCHSMLHRRKPPLSIQSLRELLS